MIKIKLFFDLRCKLHTKIKMFRSKFPLKVLRFRFIRREGWLKFNFSHSITGLNCMDVLSLPNMSFREKLEKSKTHVLCFLVFGVNIIGVYAQFLRWAIFFISFK
uniref:(northern house mosquito) hypothetical protein n=1 Tax=Culex pipiens TaxID=7175 RepID=A0A8D8FEW6_CULPI